MDTEHPRRSALAPLLAAMVCTTLLAVGCAGPRDAGETASAGNAPSTAAEDAAALDAAPTETDLDDAQILAVVRTVNSGEVAAAELATERAAAGETRQFAQHVMEEHRKGNEKLATLATSIPPRDNQVSMFLREQAAADMEKLEEHHGEAFDQAFVESQARLNQQVLDTIDRQLLPAASDQQVRELLQTTRQQVAGHLEHARQLQGGTATGG